MAINNSLPPITPRSRSASASVLPSKRCAPSTPGPHQDDLDCVTSAARFPEASPRSAAKLPELQRQLFGHRQTDGHEDDSEAINIPAGRRGDNAATPGNIFGT